MGEVKNGPQFVYLIKIGGECCHRFRSRRKGLPEVDVGEALQFALEPIL
jgi:hypothetical protein